MKTGIKQAIIIGAAVVALGGLLVQGALANPAPQPVPQTQAVNSSGARNYVNGMINYMQGWANQAAAKGQVTPQEQQAITRMYGYMRQYAGVMYSMMGGYGGYGGMMGGYYRQNANQ
ncbi:MAG: hypothetical protein M0Z41_15290 [Peptococcaceae bacterium]|jgi:hypothetical protein|nr:hypothetical protein [Peptococcaceae bacterium]